MPISTPQEIIEDIRREKWSFLWMTKIVKMRAI